MSLSEIVEDIVQEVDLHPLLVGKREGAHESGLS